MATEQDGLLIPVGMTLEDAQLALKRLEDLAKQTGQRVKNDLERGGVAGGAGAAKGIGTAAGMLNEFRQSAGRARGAAIYFAQAIETVGGASSTASKLAGSFVSGLMIGGPMGLAVAGVNALIGVFRSLKDEEKRAAEVARKASEDRQKYYEETRKALLRMKAAESGGQVGVAKYEAGQEVAKARATLRVQQADKEDAEQVIAEIRERTARAAEQYRAAGNDMRAKAVENIAAEQIAKLEKEVKEADARIVEAQRNLENALAKTGGEVTKATIEANKEAGQALLEAEAERARLEREAADRRLALDARVRTALAAGAGDLAKAEAEHENKLAELRLELSRERVEGNRRAIEQLIAQEEERYRADRYRREGEGRGQLANRDAEQEKNRKQVDLEEAKRAKEQLDKLVADWEEKLGPLTSGFTNLFTSIITDSKNAGQAIRNFFASVAQSYLQMIAQWVLKRLIAGVIGKTQNATEVVSTAPVAAAHAYASTAAIPIVGPLLAPAAAAKALAEVMALTPLAAAAHGYDIPANLNPLVQAHAKEMILPAKYADVIRGMAAGAPGGADGAPPVQVTIQALDGADVERVLIRNRRVVGEAFVRIARERGF